ncbi:MAG: DUF433 domain-containing protein [Anaerolineae bacterium]
MLESYFEFLDSGEIRIKGTRVGLEIVIRDYLQGASPEEIVLRYPTLSLEQVHAAILYYLQDREKVYRYVQECWQEGEEGWRKQQTNSSEFVSALRQRLEAHRRSRQEQTVGLPVPQMV